MNLGYSSDSQSMYNKEQQESPVWKNSSNGNLSSRLHNGPNSNLDRVILSEKSGTSSPQDFELKNASRSEELRAPTMASHLHASLTPDDGFARTVAVHNEFRSVTGLVYPPGEESKKEKDLRIRLNLTSPASLPHTPSTMSSLTPRSTSISSINRSNTLSTSSRGPTTTNKKLDSKNDGEFVCHYCDASFRIRGYLTRHIKKHAIQKAYCCPFYNKSSPPDIRCHTSGGFSRRDTYKTHLKVRHFMYPDGVKPQDRSKSSGHCAQCGEFFENTENWVEQHIETGNCKGLPEGFLQSIKCERRSGKLRMIRTSNGNSRFISTAQSVVEPKVLLNKDALEAMAIVANNSTNNNIISKFGEDSIAMTLDDVDSKMLKKSSSRSKSSSTLKRKNITSEEKLFSNKNLNPELTSISSSSINSLQQLKEDFVTREEFEPLDLPSTTLHRLVSAPTNEDKFINDLHNTKQTITLPMDLEEFYGGDDPFNIPLDFEQCPVMNNVPSFEADLKFKNGVQNVDNSSIKTVFDAILDETTDPAFLSESQLKADDEYLNFYNFTYGSNL
ncbi:hypothetical protein Kpol_1023p63 [Vanderwaltozyma polyspora DSM 70294]|uniref:Transcription factor STP1 n=1 Tax=Vanderwaltozyma polyspora (strain ATCC 22028 / DSM 70294 / BCRC 21397 / CBS 2163 / NBRC 10782 / NRRL Y-8283 / UCD 57-17) TaxID=436907 RepID=A7TFT6_VANPO|nr:uncharacterized protein Kpol_1023p63 [Vanderwaltozyma polyspora DSM 70294]EDO18894.1 hypothetical protein Kpol_1023p63 [Vanderwaltozyma polyspora DSM 70294]